MAITPLVIIDKSLWPSLVGFCVDALPIRPETNVY